MWYKNNPKISSYLTIDLTPFLNLQPSTQSPLTVCSDWFQTCLSFLPQLLSKSQICICNCFTCGRSGIKRRMGHGTYQPILFSSWALIMIQMHQSFSAINTICLQAIHFDSPGTTDWLIIHFLIYSFQVKRIPKSLFFDSWESSSMRPRGSPLFCAEI